MPILILEIFSIRPDARIVLLDYGMVLEITSDFRQDLLRIAIAGVRRDVDELINLFYKLDLLEPDVSPSIVKEAAQAIMSIHYDKKLTQRQIQEITNQILARFIDFRSGCRRAWSTSSERAC